MIFGKTKEQRNAALISKIKRNIKGYKRFAFLPVKLSDGRYAWLQTYWVDYRYYTNCNIVLSPTLVKSAVESNRYINFERKVYV